MRAVVKNPAKKTTKKTKKPVRKRRNGDAPRLSARQLSYIKQLSRTLLSGGTEFTVKLTRHDVEMLEGILKRG